MIESILLTIIGAFLIYLKLSDALKYYVRPDYQLFTLVMGVVLLISGIANFVMWLQRPKVHTHNAVQKFATLLSIFLIFGLGFVVPRRPLSAEAAALRGTNQSLISGTQEKNLTLSQPSPLLQNVNSNDYNIADWIRLFSVDPEPDNYIGKPISVDGFVQTNVPNGFTISRFVVTCCAVDATPIGIIVDQNPGNLQSNDWVHVTGRLNVKMIDNKRQIVIDPQDVKKISQPSEPYLY